MVGLVTGCLPVCAVAHDDPPPTTPVPTSTEPRPIAIEAGSKRFLNNSTYSTTLSLEGAVSAGVLEEGQAASVAAAAQEAASTGSSDGNGGTGAGAESAGGGTESANSGECAWRAASMPAGDPVWGGNDPAAGSLMVNICNGPTTYLYVPNAAPAVGAAAPPPPPDPAVLAQRAYAELTLPTPAAHRSPSEANSDPDHGGLPFTIVGLRTWVWVADWQPLQRTVALQGVSVTLTAAPTGLVFDPGNGDTPVACEGPGRPWTRADGNEPPVNGGCAYVYRRVSADGPVTATTSVQWSVSWTSNTGAGGAFPTGVSQVSDSFLVEQIQVVVR